MNDACDAENAVLAIPIDAEVFLLSAWKGDVDGVVGGCVEEVGARLEISFVVGPGGVEALKAETFSRAKEIDTEAIT